MACVFLSSVITVLPASVAHEKATGWRLDTSRTVLVTCNGCVNRRSLFLSKGGGEKMPVLATHPCRSCTVAEVCDASAEELTSPPTGHGRAAQLLWAVD